MSGIIAEVSDIPSTVFCCFIVLVIGAFCAWLYGDDDEPVDADLTRDFDWEESARETRF